MGFAERPELRKLTRRTLLGAFAGFAASQAFKPSVSSGAELGQSSGLDCPITLLYPTPSPDEQKTHLPQFVAQSIPAGEEAAVWKDNQRATINTGRLSDNRNRGSFYKRDLRLRPYLDERYEADCGSTVQLRSIKDEPLIPPSAVSGAVIVLGAIGLVSGAFYGVRALIRGRSKPDWEQQAEVEQNLVPAPSPGAARYARYDGVPIIVDRDDDSSGPPSSESGPIFDPPEAAQTGGPATGLEISQGNLSENPGQDIVVEPTVIDRVSGSIPYQDEDVESDDN